MSDLQVTIELPATEYMEHEGAVLVRCPLDRTWVALTDYYSEVAGQLLPLVGNVDYQDSTEHWVEKQPVDADGNPIGEPVMQKEAKEPTVWKEVVRILPALEEVAPEGGVLSVGAHDSVQSADKFGG